MVQRCDVVSYTAQRRARLIVPLQPPPATLAPASLVAVFDLVRRRLG